MILKRVILFLGVSILIFGIAGGVSVVAAATDGWSPGAGGHEPDFFSPTWNVPTYTPMSEPDFLLPTWKVPTYTPISEPDFLLPTWKVPTYTPMTEPNFMHSNWSVPTYTPMTEPNFMYSNWSVPKPVLFRYSLIDPSRIDSYNLNPFASDAELRAQGWHITNSFW
ncbi:MAG: hypothetical protein WCK53_02175 [Methanomicrobiales archaeon]